MSSAETSLEAQLMGHDYWSARWEKKRALVELGMADLALWLRDQLGLGLEQLRRGGAGPITELASRMLNVECKGIAERLERLATLIEPSGSAQSGLDERLDAQLLALGELALLSKSFERLARLSFEQRVSLLSQIGLSEEPKSARAKPELEGRWVALSQLIERERGLLCRRQWLARLPSLSELEGLSSEELNEPTGARQRASLTQTIDYAWGSAPLPPQAPLGGVVQQPLRRFEGLAPRRVLLYPLSDQAVAGSAERPYLVTSETPSLSEWRGLPWSPSLKHSRAVALEARSEAPWSPNSPALITRGRVVIMPQGQLAYLDAEGELEPLSLPAWSQRESLARRSLLCLGGAGPVSLVGEWSAEGLSVLSLISERGGLHSVSGGRVTRTSELRAELGGAQR